MRERTGTEERELKAKAKRRKTQEKQEENGDVQWRDGRTTDRNVGRERRTPSDGKDHENTAKDGKLGNAVPEDG